MKKLYVFSFLLLFVFIGCRKDDNPHLSDVAPVPVPQITKDATADQTISGGSPDEFSGKINVDLYFKDGTPPSKIDLVVIKNGDTKNVQVVQADITSFPTAVTVTGTQIAGLFNAPIEIGDNYDFGADITAADGVKYEAFPATGVAYGSGISSLAGLSLTVRYSSVCLYDPAIYQGDFVVVKDEWEDYQSGDVIQLTKIDDTHFSFEYNALDAQPIVVAVDPVTNTTSVAKQVYGNYGTDDGDFSAESVEGSNDNYVAPCDKIFSVRLEHTVAAGSYGQYAIVLQKKQ